MKKILCVILTASLLLTPSSIALAKSKDSGKQHNQSKQQTTQQQKSGYETKKQDFKMNGSSIFKYGKYSLPLAPIIKGMGAVVTFDKTTAVLTVVKSTISIVINFKDKTVMVNGVADTKSGIFTAKNDKKKTVLIKYIAKTLGVRVYLDKEKVTVEIPRLDLPTDVTVTTTGTTVIANTLNTTSLSMSVAANIKAGQATGGKAELYVGSKLIATDAVIAATDTSVTFATADETPTNAELQAVVPEGGVVTVKLYNASNSKVTSKVANPTLVVDYVAPTVTGVTAAVYSISGGALYLNVTGTSAVGDTFDVTKLSLYDTTLNKTYQLTNALVTGSNAVINDATSVTIKIGSVDRLGMIGFGTSTMFLTVNFGPLVTDAAGNSSPSFTQIITLPVIATN